LGVAAGGRSEFDVGVAAVHVDVDVRVFHVAFAPRLDGVVEADLVGISAENVQVAHVEAQVHPASSGEFAHLVVGF
jgi:hypothetical protein